MHRFASLSQRCQVQSQRCQQQSHHYNRRQRPSNRRVCQLASLIEKAVMFARVVLEVMDLSRAGARHDSDLHRDLKLSIDRRQELTRYLPYYMLEVLFSVKYQRC